MRIKVSQERFFCGLDIGSQKVKAGVLQLKDNQHLELIGVYEMPLKGFREASVSDLAELTECISFALGELGKKTGTNIKEVQLGVNCELVGARRTSTLVPLLDRGSKVIANRDIKRVNEQAKLLGVKTEEEVLHDLPLEYRVDDVDGILNPFGLYGRKLGVHSFILIAQTQRLRNLIKAVNQAGYDVGNVFFSSFAASEVALTDDQKNRGCALIDIGSKVTSLLIFKDKVLRHFERIEFGGDEITKAIANALQLPLELAEEIKKSYGTVLHPGEYAKEEILVKREDAYTSIQREEVYKAIEPLAVKFIDQVQTSIKNSNLSERLDAGLVMMGGAALLGGFIERVSKDIHNQSVLAKINLATQKAITNAAIYTSVVGIAYSGYKKTLAYSLSKEMPSSWVKKMTNKAVELYQEYF